MKLKIALPLVALLLAAALIYGYLQRSKERANEAQADKPVTAESKVERATNGNVVASMDERTQKLIGLETTLLTPATLPPEIKGYGRVLEPAPLVALVSGVASASASLDASRKEYQRVKALFAQGENASARALQAGEAAMKHDQIALQTSEAELVAAWGESVAHQPDLPAFVQSLATRQAVLVRLDLPAGELTTAVPVGGRLLSPGTGQPITARFLGPAATTEPQIQGQGFLLVMTNSPAWFSPGLALAGFLQLPGEPLRGVIVPEAAVVRTAERTWVYLQTGPTNFTRRDVSQEHPVPDGWFVTAGVMPNDRVVTTGAQTLLSEERKTEIDVGD
jgi:hypothetical protein